METSICIGKRGLLSVFVCLFASAFLSVSCAENDTESSPSGETASLTVTLNRQADPRLSFRRTVREPKT